MALSQSPTIDTKVDMFYHVLFKIFIANDDNDMPSFLRFAREVTSNTTSLDVAVKAMADRHGINVFIGGTLINAKVHQGGDALLFDKDLGDAQLLPPNSDDYGVLMKKHDVLSVAPDIVKQGLQAAYKQWLHGDSSEDRYVIDFIGDQHVAFVDEEIIVEYDAFISVPDAATQFDSKMTEVMVADLACGTFTGSINVRMLVDLIESEAKYIGVLTPVEQFIEGRTSAIAPLIPCVKLVFNDNFKGFLDKWRGIIENKLTTYIERWRITMFEQFPYLRNVDNVGVRITTLDECPAYNDNIESMTRLIGTTVIRVDNKPVTVYKGDQVDVLAILTGPSHDVVEFDMALYRDRLKHLTNTDKVIVVFNTPVVNDEGKIVMQSDGKVVNVTTHGFDVVLNGDGVFTGFKASGIRQQRLSYNHSIYSGYYVFRAEEDMVLKRKRDLLMKPHRVLVNDVNDIVLLYPTALEVALMAFTNDDGGVTFDATSMLDTVNKLNMHFPMLSLDATETSALRSLIDARVVEEIMSTKEFSSDALRRKPEVRDVDIATSTTIVRVTSPYSPPQQVPIRHKSENIHPESPMRVSVQAIGLQPLKNDGIIVVDFGFLGVPFDKGTLLEGKAYDPISGLISEQNEIEQLRKDRSNTLLNSIIKSRSEGVEVKDDCQGL